VNILAIDTTGEVMSLALQVDGKILATRPQAPGPHDETIIAAVERLLKKGGLSLPELDAIAAASGPGRFTGIRIGMAYAAVAASRLKIPALAVSRFEALAFGAWAPRFGAVIEGHRGEKFYQLFSRACGSPRTLGKPQWVSAQVWGRLKGELSAKGYALTEALTEARDLLEPAAYLLGAGRVPAFAPLYLKPAGYEAKPC
jgi:tRNA threonylcarbamoyl adenosine modification protein YeaZ